MTTVSTTSVPERSRGRACFWVALGACLLGLGLCVVQYLVLKLLIVPWYVPILTTLGVLLLFCSVTQRRTVARLIALGLIAALAAFEWYFLVSLSRVPGYDGPVRVGQKLPAFHTTLADGRSFTDKDLENGTPTVLVFFRGRW